MTQLNKHTTLLLRVGVLSRAGRRAAAARSSNAALAAWVALPPPAVTNQPEIDAAAESIRQWEERNMKLYGLLVQSLPEWLITSVYNTCRNDGLAAIEMLRNSFDANHGRFTLVHR